MKTTLSQSETSPEHSAMDYTFLRKAGIRHLQQMAEAGMLWTDFNTHDPGITILEQLCYAITDLGYRIDYQIPDLLASGGGGGPESFHSAAHILTTHPVTLDDLRKLVLDVDGVKNVWIEKVDSPQVPLQYDESRQELTLQSGSLELEPVRLKGLYRVLIETSDLADIDGTVVKQAAVRKLHANRPLCEDYEEIRILSKQAVKLNARIEIGPVDDAEEVLSFIYEKISNYFSPRIPFASITQMLEKDLPADRIFDGPQLEHGFVETEKLRRTKRRTTIYTSDLVHAIMDVDGVRAVRDISVAFGERKETWALKLPADSIPVLDLNQSKIIFEKNRLVAEVDHDKARKKYFDRLTRAGINKPLKQVERDLISPPGRDRNIAGYYSIQYQFPACYGIGEMGLPASATAQRKVQAKQLKAYLLFFDQLLANYFAQLAHVKDLFSVNGSTIDTYFTQAVPDNGLGLEEIYNQISDDPRDIVQSILDDLVPPAIHSERKNRFLNHLLARFAEQFTDYSLFLFDVTPPADDSTGNETDDKQASPKQYPAQKMIRDKQAFLQQYPIVSSARGTAFNYLEPLSRENVSGLEKRIKLKLGLVESRGEVFYMVEHILLRPMEEDLQQQIAFLRQARSRDPYSLQLSFVFPTTWNARMPRPDYAGMTDPEKTRAKEAFESKQERFRNFIEQTVREETPAHLAPHIHWLSAAAMKKFEQVYRAWVERRRNYWAT